MADTKISALSALSSANITATDAIPIVDDMSGTPATYRGSVNDLRGSWEFIASVEDSDVAALEITDIPTGFDLHRLTIPWVTFETDEVCPILLFSDDNGSTFETTSYSGYGASSSTAARVYAPTLGAYTDGIYLSHGTSYLIGNDTNEGFHTSLILVNLTIAAYSMVRGEGFGHTAEGAHRPAAVRAEYQASTVIDALQLKATSDNISGKMVLEGYRY